MGEYEDVHPVDEDDFDRLEELDGTPRADGWTPIEMDIVTEDDESGMPYQRADVPWLGSYALVLRDGAIERAGQVLAPFGELLPLRSADAKLALFNPTQVLDVLDEEASQVERFPSSGRIMAIESYAFEGVPERAVFRIPQEDTGPICFTGSVVDELRALDLAGLDFKEIWDGK